LITFTAFLAYVIVCIICTIATAFVLFLLTFFGVIVLLWLESRREIRERYDDDAHHH